MSKYLIVYGTQEGQAAKIANSIAETIRQRGSEVDVFDARKVPSGLRFKEYGGVIIGSSVHALHWSNHAIKFAKQYQDQMKGISSAFFSVSMTSASPTPEQRARLDPLVEKFFSKAGWHPDSVGNFAGALAYSKYGFLTRWLMQTIARANGESTDTSHDIEYTNWEQVALFANKFVEKAKGKTAVVAGE